MTLEQPHPSSRQGMALVASLLLCSCAQNGPSGPGDKRLIGTADHPLSPYLIELSERGLVEGRTIAGSSEVDFQPEGTLTRAEFATLIDRILIAERERAPERSYGDTLIQFTDIEGHWAAESIRRAEDMGYLKGDAPPPPPPSDVPLRLVERVEKRTFRPNSDVSRGEVMAALMGGLRQQPGVRYEFAWSARNFEAEPSERWGILDRYLAQHAADAEGPELNDEYGQILGQAAAYLLAAGGLVDEDGQGLLAVREPATRAWAAAMVYRAAVIAAEMGREEVAELPPIDVAVRFPTSLAPIRAGWTGLIEFDPSEDVDTACAEAGVHVATGTDYEVLVNGVRIAHLGVVDFDDDEMPIFEEQQQTILFAEGMAPGSREQLTGITDVPYEEWVDGESMISIIPDGEVMVAYGVLLRDGSAQLYGPDCVLGRELTPAEVQAHRALSAAWPAARRFFGLHVAVE